MLNNCLSLCHHIPACKPGYGTTEIIGSTSSVYILYSRKKTGGGIKEAIRLRAILIRIRKQRCKHSVDNRAAVGSNTLLPMGHGLTQGAPLALQVCSMRLVWILHAHIVLKQTACCLRLHVQSHKHAITHIRFGIPCGQYFTFHNHHDLFWLSELGFLCLRWIILSPVCKEYHSQSND